MVGPSGGQVIREELSLRRTTRGKSEKKDQKTAKTTPAKDSGTGLGIVKISERDGEGREGKESHAKEEGRSFQRTRGDRLNYPQKNTEQQVE